MMNPKGRQSGLKKLEVARVDLGKLGFGDNGFPAFPYRVA